MSLGKTQPSIFFRSHFCVTEPPLQPDYHIACFVAFAMQSAQADRIPLRIRYGLPGCA